MLVLVHVMGDYNVIALTSRAGLVDIKLHITEKVFKDGAGVINAFK